MGKSWVHGHIPGSGSSPWFLGLLLLHLPGARVEDPGDFGLARNCNRFPPKFHVAGGRRGGVRVCERVDSPGPYNTFAHPTFLCFDSKEILPSIREANLAMVFSRRSLFYLRFRSEVFKSKRSKIRDLRGKRIGGKSNGRAQGEKFASCRRQAGLMPSFIVIVFFISS